MSDLLTLADVVSRGTPVDWYEGVALTQALCDALQRTPDGSVRQVPGLDKIQIKPDGTFALLSSGGQGQSPVQGAGRVLLALLPEHQMPVQLRLLALTAVSPTPSYASIRELSSGLEYFERPDRSRQVAQVYERCAALPASTSSEPPPLPVITPASPAQAQPRPKERKRRLRPLEATIVLVIALGLGGVAAWLALGKNASAEGGITGAVSGVAQKAVQVAGDTARAVGERLGLAPQPAVVTVERPPELPAPAKPAGTGSRPRTVRTRRSPVGLYMPPAVVPTPSALIQAAEWAADLENARMETVIARTAAVYTSEDEGVIPPQLVRPRLPQDPPPGTRLEDLPRVDLVISESGEVESVRLRTPGAGVGSMMMLSAIKNWKFEPATLAGHPVRYARSIWLTNAPR